ncbi:type II secretion system protein GspM [Eilatimonas milleporae]|uniref:Type II secretion system (T2SS) protein M subtype b n=1 Tax=Eilatimonas milleporae TaxID=911205 RepID=A0A3M0CEB7_9PROT|nr:type II secretion system protein GspM [Eilatimonas milleporae]RMB08164.1 type II secretion system (T2SS) protein M subtype b [Eilatimonas milleporae]
MAEPASPRPAGQPGPTAMGRLAAWTLAVLCAVLLIAGLAQQSIGLFLTARTDLVAAERLAARYERLAAQKDTLAAAVETAERQTGWQRAYLAGETHALAAAELQRHVGRIFTGTGASVGRVSTDRADNGDGIVTLRVQVQSDYDGLVRALAALEQAMPRTVVSTITLRPRTGRTGARGRAAYDPSALDASLTVEAVRLTRQEDGGGNGR